ncbi:hypothetical protein HNQ60_003850 [Povalibacter uvarum]|uniref:Uncharacterized protein n=1 Tax=Povalibacter uvarum TaxID=732238 RepID=A0A841HQC5_9GAMM|nr:hypothetical protein [Povalibacter uvarum]MBB6094963.1 hypothetical protein [Povalibacter uvarum]
MTRWILVTAAAIFVSQARASSTEACQLLPARVVSEFLSIPVRAKPQEHDGVDSCRYVSQGTIASLSVIRLGSEAEARDRFSRELQRLLPDGRSADPLRGLGTEARFMSAAPSSSAVLIARYDTTVLLLSGPDNQGMLVTLMRSAMATLSALGHEAHP